MSANRRFPATIAFAGLVLGSGVFVFNSAPACSQGIDSAACGPVDIRPERQQIQAAFDAMLQDQFVLTPPIAGCESNPMHVQPVATDPNWTDRMTAFPPGGAAYARPNRSGTGVVTVLAPHYVRQTVTASAKYICDQDGNVYQLAK